MRLLPALWDNGAKVNLPMRPFVANWPMPAALKRAEEHKPDLILLDMLAPKLSGPEALETPEAGRGNGRCPRSGAEQPGRKGPAETNGCRG
jgi:CheY-like chemotaxis protein